MVFIDETSHLEPQKTSEFNSPKIVDRFLAALIDLIFFCFLGYVLLSPLRRQLTISKLVDSDSQFINSYTQLALGFLFIGLIYQLVFVAWKGATPGKLIFKMKVINIWDRKKPSIVSSFLRSLFWWVSFATGLPFLSVLTNEKRRPFYDRIADTEVISLTGRVSAAPARSIVMAVRFAAVVGLIIGAGIVGKFCVHFYLHGEEMNEWRDELQAMSAQSCEIVSEAQENWPEEDGEVASRLSVAMALFSANAISSECLGVEAFRSFQNGDQIELAYLAKSFFNSDDADLSDSYLKRVCQEAPKSEACGFSEMIELWTDRSWSEATQKFKEILLHGSIYAKVWAIKHDERVKDFSSELALIEGLWPQKYLAEFLGIHRSVALWGLQRKDEARISLVGALEMMEPNDRAEISSWFCLRELADSCSGATLPSCRSFYDFASSNEDSLATASLAVTYIKATECREGDKVEYENLIGKIPNEQSTIFLRALTYLKNGKTNEALGIFKPIARDPRWDKAYRDEAIGRLVGILKTEEDLGEFVDIWKSEDSLSWEWRSQGLQLFQRFQKLNFKEQALNVGKILFDKGALDEPLRKNLIVLAFQIGQKKMAWTLLHGDGDRAPASLDSFDEIKYSLTKEFEKGLK